MHNEMSPEDRAAWERDRDAWERHDDREPGERDEEHADRERADREERERDERNRRERQDREREEGRRGEPRRQTTSELRRTIDRDYDAPVMVEHRERLHAQLDALDERGVHRIERYDGQSVDTAVGDALSRELQRERENEAQAMLDERAAMVERQDARTGTAADIDRGKETAPRLSTAAWTKDYEVSRDEHTGDVAYHRDGEERLRDTGRNIQVASDERSIHDAVRLVKEQGDERIAVRATDAEKRAAIMRECVRQDVRVACPTKEAEGEYHRAIVAVAREQAMERRSEVAQTREAARETECEMGD